MCFHTSLHCYKIYINCLSFLYIHFFKLKILLLCNHVSQISLVSAPLLLWLYCKHFTSPYLTSSAGRCTGFTKTFPSLTVLGYNSYSVQFIFPSVSSASLLPRSVGVFLCISSPAFWCPGPFWNISHPHSYYMPKPLQLC
jgi:hypothetical protein